MKFLGSVTLAVALVAIMILAGCTGTPGGITTPFPTTPPLLTPTMPGGPVLAPGTTQVMPPDEQAVFQINKDPISATVLVIYSGGTAGVHVTSIQARFTRSDGTVESKAFSKDTSPSFRMGDQVVFQGTRYTDRVEVTVGLDNGKSYKVIDQLVPYQSRP